MKKLGIGFGIIVVVLVGIILAVPLFVNVDRDIRPKIQQAIEENLNAKAEIGKLSLSVFLNLNVGIESLKIIENRDQNVLFEMKDAQLKVPLLALLSGRLSATLAVDKPTVRINRDKSGVLNVSTLMKPKTAQAPTAKSEGGGSAAGAASRVSFSTDIKNANIEFKDRQMGFEYKITELDFVSHDIGLNHPFDTNIIANLNIDNKKDIFLNGKMSLKGTTEIKMGGAGLEAFSIQTDLDLTPVEVRYSNLVKKTKEVPFRIAVKASGTATDLDIQNIEFIANTFKIAAGGTVKNYSTTPTIDFKISSNQLKLAEWKPIIKPLADFDLEGGFSFDFKTQGTPDKLQYSGQLQLADASMIVPGLVPKATAVNANIAIRTDEVQIKEAKMNLGKSDVSLSGSIKNFKAPVIALSHKSKLLDLDEMLPKPTIPAKPAPKVADDPKALEKSLAALAGPIALIRENPILRQSNLRAETNIGSLVMKNAPINEIKAVATFNGLVFEVKDASVKAFGGSGKTSLRIDFKDKKPVYALSGQIQKLDINAAVVSQMKDLDKTITGLANSNFEIHGAGVEWGDVNANLSGKGNFNVENGSWSGLTALKMIGDKLKSIPKAGDVLGGLKVSDKFRNLKANFNIAKGHFNITDGIMDLENANTTVTVVGNVAFTKEMFMKGDIMAPLGQIPKKLAAGDGRARLPYEVGGTASDPKVNWEATLKPVAMAYVQDEGQKLLQQGAEKLIKDDKVKNLLKGFKF